MYTIVELGPQNDDGILGPNSIMVVWTLRVVGESLGCLTSYGRSRQRREGVGLLMSECTHRLHTVDDINPALPYRP